MNHKLINLVLTSILGKDKHNPHGHIVLQSPMFENALVTLIHGLNEDDQRIISEALEVMQKAIQLSIETHTEDEDQECPHNFEDGSCVECGAEQDFSDMVNRAHEISEGLER